MTNPSENSRSFDWPRRLPWILFFFALAIRLIGVTWGLPNKDRYWSYHPDEPVNLFYARQVNVGAGDFDPGFYNYGTMYLTLSSVADKVVAAYSPVGENPTREAIAEQDAKSILAGRLINVFAGAGTVVLVFLTLRRWQGLLASALGATLIAVAPGHVVHSRFMTVDVLATFFVAASLYCGLRLIPASEQPPEDSSHQSWKWPILAGVFAGLSAGTKYNGILILVALIAALALARPRQSVVKGLAAFAASVVAFLISTPGALTNTEKFKTDLSYELAHSRSGHGLVFEGMPSSFWIHITNLLVGIGLVTLVFAVAGFVMGARKKSAPLIATLVFTFIFYLVLGRAEIAFLRYTFPLYIGLSIGLGWFVGEIQNYEKLAKVFTAAVIVGLGGLPFGDGFMATGRYMVAMAGLDSRDAVIRYFNGAKDAKPVRVGVVADPWFYSPPYFKDANAPRFMPLQMRDQAMKYGPFNSPARPEMFVPTSEPKFDWDVRLVTESKPDYIVFSSFEMTDLERLSYQTGLRPELQLQVDRYKAFIQELEKVYQGDFYAGFPTASVHDMEYVRPQIWVWKRKPKP